MSRRMARGVNHSVGSAGSDRVNCLIELIISKDERLILGFKRKNRRDC
jgi:hypothetical protein